MCELVVTAQGRMFKINETKKGDQFLHITGPIGRQLIEQAWQHHWLAGQMPVSIHVPIVRSNQMGGGCFQSWLYGAMNLSDHPH